MPEIDLDQSDPPQGQPTFDGEADRLMLDEVLDSLGWADGEFTAVCHRPIGGEFTSSVVKSVDASARVKSLPDKECIWFSVNPTAGPERHNQGRGREREDLPCLWYGWGGAVRGGVGGQVRCAASAPG